MPLIKPQAQPGIISQASQVQAQGAWYAGNLVRWHQGFLEKMGGWLRLFQKPFLGLIRQMHAWEDLGNHKNLLVGDDVALELMVNTTKYTLGRQISFDAGYIVQNGATADATTFTVANGSPNVTVNTDIIAVVGQTFTFQLPVSIGGQLIPTGSTFTVASVIPGTGFTFSMPTPSTYAETATYGVPLLNNNAANVITVTFRAHGLIVGNTWTFDQATTVQYGTAGTWEHVNFTAPAGAQVTVATVPTVDTFTFQMGTLGTGDGAGTSYYQAYEGSSVQNSSGTLVSSIGTVIGMGALGRLVNPQRFSWFLDNLGEDGLALQTGGPLEVYLPPATDGAFTSVVGSGTPPTAPQTSNGMFVAMPQAQVILFGTEPVLGSGNIDPLLVRFSDAGTYDSWEATVSNQAGSYRLSRGSKIVGGIQAPQTTLLLTDVDLWSMSYIGPPLVYGFTIMGSGCGLVAPHAIATLGKTTYWLSLKNVWQFGDGGVQMLPCSVWDFIFKNLDTINIFKCHAAANSVTGEVAFYFPAADEAFIPGQNLLLCSQDFTCAAWTLLGATANSTLHIATGYVYEPQFLSSGWADDTGANIAWIDKDIQAAPQAPVRAPDGTYTATELLETQTNGLHQVSQEINKAEQVQVFTFSLYIHQSSTRNVALRAGLVGDGNVSVVFNPVTGVEVATGRIIPFQLNSWGVTTDDWATGPTGNGWLRYFIVFQTDDSDTLDVYINLANGTQINYLGTNGFAYIWGAQLNLGGELLEYMRTGDSIPQNETRHYIKFNTQTSSWDSGTLQRSAWMDISIWGTPLGADVNFDIQQHERGYDDDVNPMAGAYVESGFTELGDGSQMMSIHQCQPDFKWFGNNGEVTVTLKAKNYPGGPEVVYGPFSMTPETQFFNPRCRGRLVAICYDWSPLPGFSARVGAVTYKVKPTGRRP